MRYAHLDLGMACAAAVRGYTCRRHSDDTENETLVFNGEDIVIKRNHGKDCKLQHSGLWLDWLSEDWYIQGDDKSWSNKRTKGE